MGKQDDPRLRDIEEVFLERAREDPEFLKVILDEAEELLAEDEVGTCGAMLKTYIVASEKLTDAAALLNKSEEETANLLGSPGKHGAASRGQLEKLIEFLKL